MRTRNGHYLPGAALLVLTAGVGVLAARPGPPGNRWICQGADGTFVSAHATDADARASCQRRAQAAAGGIFIVVAAGSTAMPMTTAPPVVVKLPACTAPGACPATLPLSGRRGSWSWVPPARLENGNIQTDLVRFEMYRQAFGGPPERVADISAKVTNLYWGMDTRDANACFWIQAVRVNSAPMPSDRSNRICMDAEGQLLPQA